ncbi:MAG TPA: hypothetical protein VLA61_13750 [Ideonella sp.]|uniref:hypothetical protein n=1 Tax=Ideonella sp. TaxID=1929293 RepID=UPI002BE924D3|nr:hypothetical protein [Ideonella sp.]HSI49333.1 hypothetical protein [Ideonella sp.]
MACLAGPLAAWGQGAPEAPTPEGLAPAPEANPPGLAPPLYQPQAWTAGPFQVTPQLGLAYGSNSNLRLQPTKPLFSHFHAWMPGLSIVLPDGDQRYELSTRAEITRQLDSPQDNTTNAELALDGLNLLDERTALAWRAVLQDWHDVVGAGSDDTADHFRAHALAGVLRHDSEDGLLRLEAEFTSSAKRYLNHREQTAQADMHTRQAVLRAQHLVAPGVRVGAELRDTHTRYPLEAYAADNGDRRWYATVSFEPTQAGMPWPLPPLGAPVSSASAEPAEPAAADATPPMPEPSDWPGLPISGTLKLGSEHKGFEAYAPYQGYNRRGWKGLSWEGELHWLFEGGHQLDLGLSRGASDAPGDFVDYQITKRIQLGGSLRMSERQRLSVSVSRADARYRGDPFPLVDPEGFPVIPLLERNDRLDTADFAWRFDLARNWQLGVNLGWARRQSTLPFAAFIRRMNSLTLTANL